MAKLVNTIQNASKCLNGQEHETEQRNCNDDPFK